MAEKSWLFNSVNGDRAYNAEDIGAFLAPFFSGGIFANPSTNLQVTADGSGMSAYNIVKLLIKLGRTTGLQAKVNMFYACGQLSDEEYTELTNTLTPATTTTGTAS